MRLPPLSPLPQRTSIQPNARRADHLAPLGGLVRDVLPECGLRVRKYRIAGRLDARLDGGVGERSIDGAGEPLDDLGRSALWRTQPLPARRLVTRDRLAQRGRVGERLRALRRGDAERAQPARLDVLDRGRERVEDCLY